MDIIKNIEIKFTEQDIKTIVASYCCEHGYSGVKPEDVTVNIGTRCEGYGYGEHDVHYLKGCSVKCNLK